MGTSSKTGDWLFGILLSLSCSLRTSQFDDLLHIDINNDLSSSFSKVFKHLMESTVWLQLKTQVMAFLRKFFFLSRKSFYSESRSVVCWSETKYSISIEGKSEILLLFSFLSGCTLEITFLCPGNFLFRYSRSLFFSGMDGMVKKTDDCKNANIARHTQRPMFSFKEEKKLLWVFLFQLQRSYSISLLVCSLSDGFSQTEVAQRKRFEANETTSSER